MRLLLLLVLCLAAAPALAADATQPHPHRGLVPAFTAAPPIPALTPEDEAKLAAGEAVLKQEKGESGGRGIAVQDVHAPAEVVWSRITRYEQYPEWVDGVYETEVYETTGEHIKVRFLIGAALVKVEYFVDHLFRPAEGYMTWTLDYDRESDLDDSVGFWRLQPVADKPGWTRVFYSVDVRLKGWVPGFVESMLAKSGLTKATAWVKRESEEVAP